MKKIFGVMSLIAILTVSFTLQATANIGNDNNVEFVVSTYSPDYVAVATLDTPKLFELFNVTEVDFVNYSGKEGVISTNIVTGDSAIISKFGNVYIDLPIDYGSNSTSSNVINSENSSNSYIVESWYSDAESPVGWNLTKI